MNGDFSLEVMKRIEGPCTRFEKALQDSESPRIESYLEQVSEDALLPLLQELLLLEFDSLHQRKGVFDVSNYRDRFPEPAGLVDAVYHRVCLRESSRSSHSTVGGEGDTQGLLETEEPLQVGRYIIERAVASGGFGTVYLAYDFELARRVCLKTPRRDRPWSEGRINRFLREARIVAQLKHPGIVPVYDFGREEKWPYVVMPFFEGGTVETLLADPPSVDSVLALVIRIADAVAHAHDNGLVHRDLKPRNILLNGVGDPCVADFGLAVYREEANRQTQLMGTLAYMAPEQLDVSSQPFDERTDIWALGVILFELLTGKHPFEVEGRDGLKSQIRHAIPAQLDLGGEHADALEAICKKAMAKQSEDRFQDAREFADSLRQLRESEQVAAPPRRMNLVLLAPAIVLGIALVLLSARTFRGIDSTSPEGSAAVAQSPLIERLWNVEPASLPPAMADLREDREALAELREMQPGLPRSKQLRAHVTLLPGDPDLADDVFEHLLVADADHFPIVLVELQRYEERLPQWLERELDAVTTRKDEELDAELPADLLETFQNSLGSIDERGAFCQALSMPSYHALSNRLNSFGYRPVRLRPYQREDALLLTAIWVKDGLQGRADIDLKADQLIELQTRRTGSETLQDVSVYHLPGSSSESEPRYSAVWAQRAAPETALALGSAESYAEQLAVLQQSGFQTVTFDASMDATGNQESVSICVRPPKRLSLLLEADSRNFAHVPVAPLELHVHQTTDLREYPRSLTSRLRIAEEIFDAKLGNARWIFEHARASFHLGDDEAALEGLATLSGQDDSTRFHAASLESRIHARQRSEEQARSALERCRDLNPAAMPPGFELEAYLMWLEATVAAYLEQESKAVEIIEQAIARSKRNREYLIYAACVRATLFEICIGAKRHEDAQDHAWEATSLLGEAEPEGGYGTRLLNLRELDSLRRHPKFVERFPAASVFPSYTGIYSWDANFEGAVSSRLTRAEHLQAARSLMAREFRPVAISVAELGPGEEPATVSAWNRPSESKVRRCARAAVALSVLGDAGQLRRLLASRSQSRLRERIIHDLDRLGADPQLFLSGATDPDPKVRRALVLGINSSTVTSDPDLANLVAEQLLNLYEQDPDPGVHSAARWSLNQLGFGRMIEEIDQRLATGKLENNRHWYVSTAEQTLAVIPAPGEFWARLPTRTSRFENLEELRPARLDHSFAIGIEEVTVEQYRRFDADYQTSAAADAPVTNITWLQAAAFCDYLSELDGLEPFYEQKPDGSPGELKMPARIADREGYRLPSEWEWSYACRSGVYHKRFFGQTEDLLDDYAWHHGNSGGELLPAIQKKPNPTGLFCVYGAAMEMCLNRADDIRIQTDGSLVMTNKELVTPGEERVVRGGSYLLLPVNQRSGFRQKFPPHTRQQDLGFRIARTISPPTVAAE